MAKLLHRYGRKVLSLVLTLVMLTSMMQLTAFAADGAPDQITGNGEQQSFADGKVKISKMIEATGTENVFDITLNVETTQSYETVILTPPAAVSLVIDTSTSMNAEVKIGNETKTRLGWAQDAAEDFVKKFADPNGAARYVALSEFYRVGYAKSSGGQYWFNVSDPDEQKELIDLIDALVYTNHSGTNMEAGLLMAEHLLKQSPVNNLDHKFLLVLSDGAPNAVSTANPSNGYVAGEYNGGYGTDNEWDKSKYDSLPLFDDWAGYSGGGRYIYKAGTDVPDGSERNEAKVDTMDNDGYYPGYYYSNGNKVQMTKFTNPHLYAAYRAHNVAEDITAAGTPIYTMNYGSAGEMLGPDETNYNTRPISGYNFTTGYSVGDWLKYHIASHTNNAYGSGDGDSVAEMFTSILGKIQEDLAEYAQAWTVTDPMGERIEYISGSTNDGSLAEDDGELVWTLADPTTRVEGNKTYYTYSATYRVKLDNVTAGFNEGSDYATNGTTELTYWLLVDDNGDQYYVNEAGNKITSGDPTLTAAFKVPSVEGFLADLTFTKVDENGAPMAGVQFNLSNSNIGFSRNASSDENGVVSFEGIPSGYTYTLSETAPPQGYDPAPDYTVTVAYDELSVAGVNDPANFEIVNEPSYVPTFPSLVLTAEKFVNGAKTALEADQFEFELREGSEVLETVSNNANGIATFTGIQYDAVGTYEYTVREVIPDPIPDNWTYDDSVYTVTVEVKAPVNDKSDYTMDVTVTLNGVEVGEDAIDFNNTYVPDHQLGSITVTKNSSGAETPEGATFQLQKLESGAWVDVTGKVATYEDFEDGEYTFDELEAGQYRVVETNADQPLHNRVTVNNQTATLNKTTAANGDTAVSDGQITITNTYTAQAGSLTITKTVLGLTAPAALADETAFAVTGPNGYSETVTYGNIVAAGANGYVINGLTPGNYTVAEGAANVAGYQLTSTTVNGTAGTSATVAVADQGNANVAFVNTYVRELGNLKFVKTVSDDVNDETVAVPADAAFTITGPADFQTVTISYSDLVDGEYLLPNVPTGNYTVTEDIESAQVSGYTLSVTNSGVDSVAVTTGNTAENPAELALHNTYTQKVGSVTIEKTITGAVNMMPADAAFQLKKGETVKFSAPFSAFTLNNETGKYTYTFNNVPVGDYTLVEVGATNATVEQTHVLSVTGIPSEAINVSLGTVTIPVNNHYEPKDGALTIIKEASGLTGTAVVPGTTTFTVTGPNGYSNTVELGSGVNADGKRAVTVNNLKPGTYTVVENTATAAVAGHDLISTTYSVSEVIIAPNGSGTITVTNVYAVHTGSVTITKTATPANVQIPEGTTFQLKQGEQVRATATYSQFVGGSYTFQNVPIGDYTVVELRDTAAVAGYDLTVNDGNASVSVTVTKDTDSPAAFVNHYLEDAGTLKILKTASGLPVPAATIFTVTGPNGYSETFRYDQFDPATHILTISGLVPGEYTVTEDESTAVVDVKYGLTVTYPSGQTVNVEDDGEATVTIHNSYAVKKGSLTITKGIVGDNLMPDTTMFQLKDASGNNCGAPFYWSDFTRSTDGKSGTYTINDLTVGTYTLVETGATNTAIQQTHAWTVTGLEGTITIVEGTNAVTVVNYYDKSVFKYDVVHAYYVSENGGAYKPVVDERGEPVKSAPVEHGPVKIAPQNETVFNNEALSDTAAYDGYTYERKSTYAEEEVTRVGTLKEENLVYTVKYYRSNWTVGALEITKTIKGLDSKSEKKLAENLTFTVTGPNDYSETFTYGEDFENGKLLIEDLKPGTYTVTEDTASAKVANYDLTVKVDGEKGSSTEVAVKAQLNPAKVSVVNEYVGRIYTIWFDGGEHGSVLNVNGLPFEGVYRSQWWEYKPMARIMQEGFYDWANLNLVAGQHTYYSADGDIYPNLKQYHMVQDDTELVMFTFTGADWAEHNKDMYIANPGLEVDKGYTSDGKFYIPDTDIYFTKIADAVAYMDENVKPDANGIYNVLYRAVYDEDSKGGGGGGGESPLPPVIRPSNPIIPDDDVPLTDLPEDDVPMADLPDEDVPLVELPDEDVPLTGDASSLYVAMAAISGMGLIYLAATGKKREEEEAAE